MQRTTYAGGSPFEPVIGFSRAVRIGNTIHVSGTGPVGADHEAAGPQAERIFAIIGEILERAGASLRDVVRTRIYLTDAGDWQVVGAVHSRLFAATRPAATMVVVAALLHPTWHVEIEVDAVVSDTE